LRSSAGRGERHYAAVARRIEIIAVIPVRSFCHFWPGLAAQSACLEIIWFFGLGSFCHFADLASFGPFCRSAVLQRATLLDQSWLALAAAKALV
jgi:hypothetical protein